MLLSIVIPFHNEEENLKILLPRLQNEIGKIKHPCELILVDDISSDGSYQVADQFRNQHNWVKLIQLPQRSGQTGCYKHAFAEAKGKYILRIDADLQDSPEDIPLFLSKMENNADLIMGLREARKHSRIIRLASAFYDLLILAIFNSPLHSNTGSYVAFRTHFVKNIPWVKNDHRYLPLIAMRRGAKVINEVFVRHSPRTYGETKYHPIKKIFLGLPEIFMFLMRYFWGFYDFKNGESQTQPTPD